MLISIVNNQKICNPFCFGRQKHGTRDVFLFIHPVDRVCCTSETVPRQEELKETKYIINYYERTMHGVCLDVTLRIRYLMDNFSASYLLVLNYMTSAKQYFEYIYLYHGKTQSYC